MLSQMSPSLTTYLRPGTHGPAATTVEPGSTNQSKGSRDARLTGDNGGNDEGAEEHGRGEERKVLRQRTKGLWVVYG